VLDDAATAPAEIARVLTAARRQSRPVYIELPRDMVDVRTTAVAGFQPAPGEPQAAEAAAVEVIARLTGARRPALLLGVEIRRFGLEAKVAKLAKKLAIPAVTSFMGRGILAETGAPLAGTYLGLAGETAVRRIVERSDGLLMLGVILCDTNFGVSKRQVDMRSAIHAFNGEVRLGHHVYPQVSLEALVDALLRHARRLGDAAPVAAVYPTGLKADDGPIRPIDIATAVNDLIARHGVMPIASDMGDCLFTAMDMTPTAIVAPGYYATMGPGVPFGLGLQAASGKRPLILVGDGAFQMTGWELGNCRRYGWNPIVLVFNNTAWGMLKAFQADVGYNDLDDWHFAAMASSLGGKGVRVATRKALAAALEDAVADESAFRLIEIMIPRGELSRTMERFTAAIARKSALAKEA
jgi:indolepyruvate decarboxylase